MAISIRGAHRAIMRLIGSGSAEEVVKQIGSVMPEEKPLPAELPEPRNWTPEATEKRREFLREGLDMQFPFLFDDQPFEEHTSLRGSIENFVGMTRVPTGVIGPLRVNGVDAKGDFYIPMATTEGALLASYNRGARVASRAGGVTSVCLTELVQRSPGFIFRSFAESGMFLIWVMEQYDDFQEIIARHSSHARLEEIRPNMSGNQLTLVFEYTTGDAAGQNMVTICTDAICRHLIEKSPIQPVRWYVEGNLSGDKKATAMSFASVRGKKVTAEVNLSRELVQSALGTTPQQMLEYWKTSVLNGVQSGSIGVNGHFANGLAGIFLACGQDVACVAEASVGTTQFDIQDDGGLYASVTLPNMIVGTVGGGTRLPTQHECLSMLGCVGEGTSRKFAELCAATVLCGELSIVAAIASGDFAKAHAIFGRRREEAKR